MSFHDTIKKEAQKFARQNAIVKVGDIVETKFPDWKKLHKAMKMLQTKAPEDKHESA